MCVTIDDVTIDDVTIDDVTIDDVTRDDVTFRRWKEYHAASCVVSSW